ncbi:uncharacterized protein LOC141835643 [Curcuma longa]|uniref:uncharacterized protein LOC141835643 n=1 Tax=Curcuma longa TaxID=136217 RepID=UPI003D9F9F9C
MDGKGGSFVTARRISPAGRGHGYHSPPGSTAWIGRGISCVCAQGIKTEAHLIFDLTSSQEECLHRLQRRIAVVYDSTKKEHQEPLRALWCAAYPGVELLGLISEQWKDMGWQGKDPSTDFRGGGFISVENMLFFARNYPASFQDLLQKQNGERALWEYPFAVAGVNITFMLIQMLDLQLAKPRSFIAAVFLKLLSAATTSVTHGRRPPAAAANGTHGQRHPRPAPRGQRASGTRTASGTRGQRPPRPAARGDSRLFLSLCDVEQRDGEGIEGRKTPYLAWSCLR